MTRRVYITAALLGSAVCAGWFMAHDIRLPEPKPIDHNNMLAVEVVAPREPEMAPMPRTAAERLDVGMAPRYQSYTPSYRPPPPPPPVYREPVEEPRPVVRQEPRRDYAAEEIERRRASDPIYYDRYVQQNVTRPRQEPVRQYPPRYEQPRQGCNAMAEWCRGERDDSRRPVEQRQYYRQEADGSSRRVDPRQQHVQRVDPREDRGEDYFE